MLLSALELHLPFPLVTRIFASHLDLLERFPSFDEVNQSPLLICPVPQRTLASTRECPLSSHLPLHPQNRLLLVIEY